jgi:hypothetical protein
VERPATSVLGLEPAPFAPSALRLSPPPRPSQLAAAGAIRHRFGLCFGFPDAGVLTLGDAPLPPSVGPPAWTPLLRTARHAYYGVGLLGIDVAAAAQEGAADGGPMGAKGVRAGGDGGGGGGGSSGGSGGAGGGGRGPKAGLKFEELPIDPAVFNQSYGTVMDSGSNMNHLPSPAFRVLAARVRAAVGDRASLVPKVGWRWRPRRLKGGPRGRVGGPRARRQARLPLDCAPRPLCNPALCLALPPLLRAGPQGAEQADHCWSLGSDAARDPAGRGFALATRAFPTLRLRFAGGAAVVLPPYRYLFATPRGNFCLGFFDNGALGSRSTRAPEAMPATKALSWPEPLGPPHPPLISRSRSSYPFQPLSPPAPTRPHPPRATPGEGGTLIGGISARDMLVIYDVENQRIGFTNANCDKLAGARAARGAPREDGDSGGEGA